MIYLVAILVILGFAFFCFCVGLAWSRLGPDGMKALEEREKFANALYDENMRLQSQIEDMRPQCEHPLDEQTWSRQ